MNKFHKDNIAYIRAGVAGIYIACLIAFACFPKTLHTPAIKASETEPLVTPTITPSPMTWNDAIRAIFPKDEAGRMIRICMAENKGQDKYALNYNTNGTVDASWCQVNSCHKPKDMTMDEWLMNLRDPVFHAKEVRKIYLSQGWGAWVVSRWVK